MDLISFKCCLIVSSAAILDSRRNALSREEFWQFSGVSNSGGALCGSDLGLYRSSAIFMVDFQEEGWWLRDEITHYESGVSEAMEGTRRKMMELRNDRNGKIIEGNV